MPIAKKTIPEDFLNQMKTNLSKDNSTNVNVSPASNTPNNEKISLSSSITSSKETEKKDKYADVLNIRLSKGRRNEIKTFCSSCGISITQYIESSFEYFSKEVSAGRLSISKGGINRVE